jgi:hypothetical protein
MRVDNVEAHGAGWRYSLLETPTAAEWNEITTEIGEHFTSNFSSSLSCPVQSNVKTHNIICTWETHSFVYQCMLHYMIYWCSLRALAHSQTRMRHVIVIYLSNQLTNLIYQPTNKPNHIKQTKQNQTKSTSQPIRQLDSSQRVHPKKGFL